MKLLSGHFPSRLIQGLFCCITIMLNTQAFAGQWPVAGRDPVNAALIEDHSEALVRWSAKGIEDAVLINIDTHDDLRWIAPGKIEALKAIAGKKDWQAMREVDSAGEEGLYHPGSFLYAACALNMFRQIFWVIPFSYFQAQDREGKLKSFLAGYGFPQESIDTFRMHEGCFKGNYAGVDLLLCGMEHLPEIDGPVVLSIDADFLPVFADWYGWNMLYSMHVLFKRIAQQEYLVQDAVVAYSVNGGFLSAVRRWVGDDCREILGRPELISGPYPEIRLVHGTADRCYMEGRAGEELDLAGRYLKKYPEDLCLMTYQAFALLAKGQYSDAFDLVQSACLVDRMYAHAMADMGQILLDRGDMDEAMKFFLAAYELNPQMNYRQKNLADALMASSRYSEALYYYDRYRRMNGPFPAVFLMGEICSRLGEDKKAQMWFEQGIESLGHQRYMSECCRTDAEAIKKAVCFLRKKGLHEKAEFMGTHPFLKKFLETQAMEQ